MWPAVLVPPSKKAKAEGGQSRLSFTSCKRTTYLKKDVDERKAPVFWDHCKRRPRIHVVDKHCDAMLPILQAVRNGVLPNSGIRLVHFDSHPDLACLGMEVAKKLVTDLSLGKYEAEKLHKVSDIATWILPLVLAGHISEVLWLSSYWSQQMDVGTYQLLVGHDLAGHMKIAAQTSSDEGLVEEGVGLYWMSQGVWVPKSRLRGCRPFTLHVLRLCPRLTLSREQVDRICQSLNPDDQGALSAGRPPWVLDVDEDFLSCANPFRCTFEDFFGGSAYELLTQAYAPSTDAHARWEALRQLTKGKLFLQSPDIFLNSPPVARLLAEAGTVGGDTAGEEGQTSQRELLLRFRDFCSATFSPHPDLSPPTGVSCTSEAPGEAGASEPRSPSGAVLAT
eukprot:RCo004145